MVRLVTIRKLASAVLFPDWTSKRIISFTSDEDSAAGRTLVAFTVTVCRAHACGRQFSINKFGPAPVSKTVSDVSYTPPTAAKALTLKFLALSRALLFKKAIASSLLLTIFCCFIIKHSTFMPFFVILKDSGFDAVYTSPKIFSLTVS